MIRANESGNRQRFTGLVVPTGNALQGNLYHVQRGKHLNVPALAQRAAVMIGGAVIVQIVVDHRRRLHRGEASQHQDAQQHPAQP